MVAPARPLYDHVGLRSQRAGGERGIPDHFLVLVQPRYCQSIGVAGRVPVGAAEGTSPVPFRQLFNQRMIGTVGYQSLRSSFRSCQQLNGCWQAP